MLEAAYCASRCRAANNGYTSVVSERHSCQPTKTHLQANSDLPNKEQNRFEPGETRANESRTTSTVMTKCEGRTLRSVEGTRLCSSWLNKSKVREREKDQENQLIASQTAVPYIVFCSQLL